MTRIVFESWVQGNPGNITYELFDNDGKTLWKIERTQNKHSETIIPDEPIHIDNPGTAHKIVITVPPSADNNYYGFNTAGGMIRHKIYGATYAVTDKNGSYTYTVTSPWTGSLNAFYEDLKFNTLNFDELTESQTIQNFNCMTKYISGTVYDKDSNPISGAQVSDQEEIAEVVSYSVVKIEDGNGGYGFVNGDFDAEFVPTTSYLTKINSTVGVYGSGSHGAITVSILDEKKTSLYSDRFEELKYDKTNVTLTKPVKVTPGKTYYLRFSNSTGNAYAYDTYKDKLVCTIYGKNYSETDESGNYTYAVTSPWTGTLHASIHAHNHNQRR